jgi:hypothetical protein
MSDNLLENETHASKITGTIKTGTKLPVDGDELQNIEAGELFFDTEKEVLYIFDGTSWYGAKAVTTSTSSSTSTSTSTSTTA